MGILLFFLGVAIMIGGGVVAKIGHDEWKGTVTRTWVLLVGLSIMIGGWVLIVMGLSN